MARLIVVGLAVLLGAAPALAQTGPRSGVGPCRQGVLALMAMIDDGDLGSPDYRHAFRGVVETCGPADATPTGAATPDKPDACRALALKMLDEIEEGGMKTRRFVQARQAFARSCAPR